MEGPSTIPDQTEETPASLADKVGTNRQHDNAVQQPTAARRPYIQKQRRASAGAELTMRDSFLYARGGLVLNESTTSMQGTIRQPCAKPQQRPQAGSVIVGGDRSRGSTLSSLQNSTSASAPYTGPMLSFANPLLLPSLPSSYGAPSATANSSASSLAGVLRHLTKPELNTSFDCLETITEEPSAQHESEEDKKSKKKADKKAKPKADNAAEKSHHFFARKHQAREERRMKRLLEAVSHPLSESELPRLLKKKHYTAMLDEHGPDELTPLVAAVAGEGGVEAVRLLVEKGADVDGKGPNGRRPLHWAALFGETSIVTYLLENGAAVDARDADSNTPLHEAAFVGAGDTIDLLLSKGADSQSKDKHGYTPLHKAAFSGQADAILGLLTQALDIDAPDDTGATPLHIAIYNGHYEVVCLLLSFGARLNIMDKRGCTTIHYAVHGGDSRMLSKLVELGGDIHQPDMQGVYPLHIAAFAGYSHIITHLLEAGADPNVKDAHGATPLHYAAGSGDVASIMMLISYRARLNIRDEGGYTPLHHAVRNGHCECATVLLEYNANVALLSKSGKSALHYAIELEDCSLAKKLSDTLIAMGANRMLPNADNITAQDIALGKGISLLEYCKTTSLKPKRRNFTLVVARAGDVTWTDPKDEPGEVTPATSTNGPDRRNDDLPSSTVHAVDTTVVQSELDSLLGLSKSEDAFPLEIPPVPLPKSAEKESSVPAQVEKPPEREPQPQARQPEAQPQEVQPQPQQPEETQQQSDGQKEVVGSTQTEVAQPQAAASTPEAPPPPPPEGPAPPPPPALGGTPPVVLQRNRLKRFDWEPIPSDKSKNTIFGDLLAASDSPDIPLDQTRLQELFYIKPTVSRQRESSMQKSKDSAESQIVLLADQDKVKQLEMLLRSSQRAAKQIMLEKAGDTVAKDDKGEIDWDEEQRRHFRSSLLGNGLADLGKGFIESFLSQLPSDTEMKVFTNFVLPPGNPRLHLVDAFFYSLRDVPQLRERIKASLFRIEFPAVIKELTQEIDSLNAATMEIQKSPKLKRVLQWVLAMVNYLNDGHTKLGMPMTATGFHISCLTQLKDMSASGPTRTNLLRVMVQEIENKEPALLSIKDDLKNLRPWKDRMDWIKEKPGALAAQLDEIKSSLATMKPIDKTDSFCFKMKVFVEDANRTIQNLKKRSTSVLGQVLQLYAYLGEGAGKDAAPPKSHAAKVPADDAATPQEDPRLPQIAQLNRELEDAIAKGATKRLFALSRRIARLAQEVQSAAAAADAQAEGGDGGPKKDSTGKDLPDIFAILHQFVQEFEDAVVQNKEAQRQQAEAQKRRSMIEQKRQKAISHPGGSAPLGVASPRILRNLIKSPEDLRNVTSLQMMQNQKRLNNVPHELAQRQHSQKEGMGAQPAAPKNLSYPRLLVFPPNSTTKLV